MPVTASSSGRIAIIGCGSVGTACAYSLLIQSLARELLLIDRTTKKAEGEAMDLQHAVPLGTPVKVTAGDYRQAARSDIVILTAGVAGQPGDSRLTLLEQNRAITLDCVNQIMAEGFTGIFLVATNPVDILTLVAGRAAALPPHRIIGSGTVIDTARLRAMLADELTVDPRDIHAFIIGEHGESALAVWSAAKIGGIPLESYPGADRLPPKEQLLQRVIESAPEVATLKGNTCFAIASCVTRICQAILRDEHTVLPVSTLMQGQYGLAALCLSTPCIIGAKGIEQVLELPLNSSEREALEHSAQILRDAAQE